MCLILPSQAVISGFAWKQRNPEEAQDPLAAINRGSMLSTPTEGSTPPRMMNPSTTIVKEDLEGRPDADGTRSVKHGVRHYVHLKELLMDTRTLLTQ